MLRGEIKCMREKITCGGEKMKDHGEIKGRQANEENERIRGELKGADNAKEQHKFMRGKIKSEGGGGERMTGKNQRFN